MTKPKTKQQSENSAIFKVEFETQTVDGSRWIPDSLNALAFDAESAIDKVRGEVQVERKETMRLVGVNFIARADL